MKKTGQLLKDKREVANLSLGEVALATKINPKILSAIERGDEQNLPAKTILKGFVRAYAMFLKMDVEEVLRTFQEETGGASPVLERVADMPKDGKSTRREVHQETSSSAMRTAAVVVIILLIGLIIGIRELIEKYQAEKVTDQTEIAKVDPVAAPELTETTSAVAIGTSSPGEALIAAGAPVTPVTETKADAKAATDKAAADKKAVDDKKAAEEKKIADEKKTAEEKIAADKKAAEEKKVADAKAAADKKAADEKKIADEKKAAEEKVAADKKAAEEKKIADKKAADEKKALEKKLAEEKVAADKKAAEEKKAADAKVAADKKAADKLAADEKKAADKKAADEKAAADKKAADEKKLAEEKKPADVQAGTETPPVESPLKVLKNEIIIEALDKVEVKFKIKGEEKRLSLNATEVHTIRSDQPVTLDISDGGALSIIYNGRDRGVPGDLGKPKTVKIP